MWFRYVVMSLVAYICTLLFSWCLQGVSCICSMRMSEKCVHAPSTVQILTRRWSGSGLFLNVGSANFSMHRFSFLHVFLGLLYLEWKVETVDEGWALSVQQLDAGGASWCKGLLWIIVWRGKIWHTFAEIFSLPCYVLLQFDLVFAT